MFRKRVKRVLIATGLLVSLVTSGLAVIVKTSVPAGNVYLSAGNVHLSTVDGNVHLNAGNVHLGTPDANSRVGS